MPAVPFRTEVYSDGIGSSFDRVGASTLIRFAQINSSHLSSSPVFRLLAQSKFCLTWITIEKKALH